MRSPWTPAWIGTHGSYGRHADAVAAYQQALARYRDLGAQYNEADTLVRLGDTHQASGDTGAARDRWRDALAILTDLDHPNAEQVQGRLRDSDDNGFDVPSPAACR
ncbi:tetratricopeptide repeat protein [Dactylosporangium sp. NPDC000555]|uniref:tetratricopeptide repeat protein n=1 Tax=Dactylosporangium sp. NPDC000555 TaxID=3154260 RepID=UPI00332FE7EC